MKTVFTRNDYIVAEIKSWCVLNKVTLSHLARQVGVHPSTLNNFVRGISHNPRLKGYLVEKMGFDVWVKYPEQNYIVPDHQSENAANIAYEGKPYSKMTG